jgi:translation elongation factor EF-Tu-like GTPase
LAVALCFTICAWKASFTGAWQRGFIKAGSLGVYIVVHHAPLAVTGVSTLREAEELNHVGGRVGRAARLDHVPGVERVYPFVRRGFGPPRPHRSKAI